MPDDNGYPTEEELTFIREYGYNKFDKYSGLITAIKAIWWHPEYFHGPYLDKEDSSHGHYFISTCGWSGNEDIIYAMKQNTMFWMFAWQSSERGGHYHFKV